MARLGAHERVGVKRKAVKRPKHETHEVTSAVLHRLPDVRVAGGRRRLRDLTSRPGNPYHPRYGLGNGRGRAEVENWLEGLSDENFGRAAFYIDMLADRGVELGEPYTRQLSGKLRSSGSTSAGGASA